MGTLRFREVPLLQAESPKPPGTQLTLALREESRELSGEFSAGFSRITHPAVVPRLAACPKHAQVPSQLAEETAVQSVRVGLAGPELGEGNHSPEQNMFPF